MNVKVIRQAGNGASAVALVEYIEAGAPRRVTVPVSQIYDNECDMGTLLSGVPFGEVWDLHIPPLRLPERISNELRKRGLWTKADVLAHPDEAHSAVLTATKEAYISLLRYCKE